ncbi:minor capsid protein [Anaerosolibacter sp.]|uniref:phage head morphogenesis protein n=1 Tax=Anaerosolibacter sp. TaxID=1872527 RepID=UPI0039EFD9D7
MKIKPKKKWLFPFSAEREYQRFMRDFVKEMYQTTIDQWELIERIIDSSPAKQFKNDDTDTEIESLIESIKKTFVNSVTFRDFRNTIRRYARQVNTFNSNQFQEIIKSALGVNVITYEPWIEELMNVWIGDNVRLIKSIPDRYFYEIEGIVREGWKQGYLTKVAKAEIKARYMVSLRRAQLIARDQIGKLNGQITEYRQKDAGIDEYEWMTSRDSRVRVEHQERSGRQFTWNAPPKDGHPGIPINCRCIAQPILDTEKISIMGASINPRSTRVLHKDGRR